MSKQQLDCALDLVRRLPPQQYERTLVELCHMVPPLTDDLLNAVDQPLKVARDKLDKEYLLCDYNRDGDSYRSCWTNEYDPPLEDGTVPSEKLRRLEVEANAAFSAYRDLYFEGGLSSVYCWDTETGFAMCVLLKKVGDGSHAVKGQWESLHVVDVEEKPKTVVYKLTSTVMLWMQTSRATSGTMNLGGSITRCAEQQGAQNNTHLVNIGRMIEELESKMRSTLNDIYFGKTKQVVADLRSLESAEERAQREQIVGEIARGVNSAKAS